MEFLTLTGTLSCFPCPRPPLPPPSPLRPLRPLPLQEWLALCLRPIFASLRAAHRVNLTTAEMIARITGVLPPITFRKRAFGPSLSSPVLNRPADGSGTTRTITTRTASAGKTRTARSRSDEEHPLAINRNRLHLVEADG